VRKGVQYQRSKVNSRLNNGLKIVYCCKSYSYSLEGAISCVQICECYNGGGIHFDGAALRLTRLKARHSWTYCNAYEGRKHRE